jgi:hypothetical protein
LGELVALQAFIGVGPARRLDDFERIGRGDQHLGQKTVGIERYGSDELVELLFAQEMSIGGRLLLRQPAIGPETNRACKQQAARRDSHHNLCCQDLCCQDPSPPHVPVPQHFQPH